MLPSGLAEVVAESEGLARFLFHSSAIAAGVVKAAAFLPGKDGETSVFRHGAHPTSSLWQIGRSPAAGDRTLRGAALVTAGAVRRTGLEVEAAEPPPRHAAIRAWPGEDPELVKGARKERALEMARGAQLLLAQEYAARPGGGIEIPNQ